MIHRDRTPEKYADLAQSTSNMTERLLLPEMANIISPLKSSPLNFVTQERVNKTLRESDDQLARIVEQNVEILQLQKQIIEKDRKLEEQKRKIQQ